MTLYSLFVVFYGGQRYVCFVQTAPLISHSVVSVFAGYVNLWSVRTSRKWSQIVF